MKLRNKKTGEIITLKDEGELALLKLIEDSLPNGLNVWEEVKEPLIKDEKIRKAVRAWADMQGSCWITKETDQCCRDSLGYFFNSSKEIFGDLELGIEYTIAELCGEDEE